MSRRKPESTGASLLVIAVALVVIFICAMWQMDSKRECLSEGGSWVHHGSGKHSYFTCER